MQTDSQLHSCSTIALLNSVDCYTILQFICTENRSDPSSRACCTYPGLPDEETDTE